MSKLKKILLMCTAYVLVAVIAIGGTFAYLTSKDSDVNVMTMGNVNIEQHEYERVVNADGTYATANIDNRTSYVLKDFSQDKPLLPIVGNPSLPGDNPEYAGYDSTTVRMSQVDSYGGVEVFAGKNAQDKIVTVENKGTTDAFVRTFVAIECGDTNGALVKTGARAAETHDGSQPWLKTDLGVFEFDNNRYVVVEFLYLGAKLGDGSWRHANGVLPAGETTYPSLCQVYIDSTATNEDCDAIDGNDNGQLDIIVLSQAIQAAGFEDDETTTVKYPAEIALDTGFGIPEETNAETGAPLCAEWLGEEYEAFSVDTWDGTTDTSWYNDTDATFALTSAEQLAGFGKLVDDGNTFEGKTIKLDRNVDLYVLGNDGEPVSFNPIGYGYNTVFKGTFDGNYHTISNLYQNGWALGYDYSTEGGGLFASVVDATIKNLTIDGAEIVMECIDMGTVVGYSYGKCTYENISITNSSISNYNRYTGGVVGEVNGIQTFKNVDIDSSCSVNTLWGSFDTAVGGIVGGKWGDATLTFEDCDVACQIDSYNDITATPARQWYAYRRAGMLIGNSEETISDNGISIASASYLTAKNCTVTYSDWANYTYCEFNNMSTSWPHCRVQAGSSSAYTNARYGVANDLNGNKVVNDNHVHATGEDHNLPITFDQLFGGDVGVYGGKTHDGVKVVYNNK